MAAGTDEPLVFTASHGADAPERATVPYIAASTAAVSGRRAVVISSVEGVRVGVAGYAEQIAAEDMPALAGLVEQFVDAGGELWLCSACVNKRGITGDELIDGARIVGAAQIVELQATGRTLTLS